MGQGKLTFSDYPSLLKEVRTRPQLWHGGKERSSILLDTFLCGITLSESYHKVPLNKRISGFDWEIFEKWVEEKYNPRKLTHRSFYLAEHITKSESKGFDLWFEWYDEFNESIGKTETNKS